MRIDLLPCPDCGSHAEVKEAIFLGSEQSYSYVHCANPLCHLFNHNPHFTGYAPEENDEHAAQSWNERFADTLHFGEVGAMHA